MMNVRCGHTNTRDCRVADRLWPPSEIISPGASPNRPLTIGRACHKGDLLSKSAEIFDHFAFSPAAVVAICFGQK